MSGFIVSGGAISAIDRAPFPVFAGQRRIHMGEHRYLTYEEIWRRQPQLRTVVGFIARNMAQVGIKVLTKTGADGMLVNDPAHPLHTLLHRPMQTSGGQWTHYRLINDLLHCQLIYDNAYWLKVAPSAGVPQGLLPLLPRFVAPMGENWDAPEAYRVRGNMGEYVIPPNALVHFHGWNPIDPRVGVSPIETLRMILAEEFSAMEYREQMWRSGARTSGVLTRPVDAPEWGTTARDQFLESWAATWSGESRQAGGTPILEEGMTWAPSSMTPKDAQYIESRALTMVEVLAAYWLPQAGVASTSNDTTLASLTDMRAQLYGDSLAPWAAQFEQDIEQQLLCDVDPVGYINDSVKVRFDFSEKMRGNIDQEATIAVQSVGGPWITRNEQRAVQGLAPKPGGDDLITPLNVVTGGLANPMDTAPDRPDNGASNGQPSTDPTTTYEPPVEPKALVKAKPFAVKGDGAPRQPALVMAKPFAVKGDGAPLQAALEKFYGRQGASVVAKVGAKAKALRGTGGKVAVSDVFNAQTWNSQLKSVLQPQFTAAAVRSGRGLLKSQGGDPAQYGPGLVKNYMDAKAAAVAESINAATQGDIEAALQSEDQDPVDGIQQLFAQYADSRAQIFAESTSTSLASWGANDAADQTGLSGGTKTWSTGDNPRPSHADVDGETVSRGDTFSNGMMWPGDSSAGPDESDGCNCSMTMNFGSS
jgi:HK97 family phage portal protein